VADPHRDQAGRHLMGMAQAERLLAIMLDGLGSPVSAKG
jgi:hypothetical protein